MAATNLECKSIAAVAAEHQGDLLELLVAVAGQRPHAVTLREVILGSDSPTRPDLLLQHVIACAAHGRPAIDK